VSMTISDFFEPEQEDISAPEFAKVLKGFDPMQVETYVYQVTQQIHAMEKELQLAREQRDAATRRYTAMTDEAYRRVAARMADVLLLADQHATNVREEAEQEAARRIAQTMQEVRQIRQDAEEDAGQVQAEASAASDALKQEGEDALRAAEVEVERILGGLMLRREQMVADLSVLRDRTASLIREVDSALAAAAIPVRSLDPAAADEAPARPSPLVGDTEGLLLLGQGFDMVVGERIDREDQSPGSPSEDDLDLWR
jgi:cell division septum initiation protein DivIVA